MNLRNNLDWVDALKARQPKKEAKLGEVKEEDVADSALDDTLEIVMNVSDREASNAEKIQQAAKDIQKSVAKRDQEAVDLEAKARVEQKKDIHVKEARERQKQEWQEKALSPAQAKLGFDPETAKQGRIMSTAAQGEDSRGGLSHVPANANSIFDPFRLDRMAQEQNEHDQSVQASRQRTTERAAEHVKEAQEAPCPISVNEGAKLTRSGGMDSEAFVQRVPANQVSMLDAIPDPTMSAAERAEKMEQLFVQKIEDNKATIQKAQTERKESIQGKKEKDTSWEQVSPPTTTSDIADKLMKLWSPKK